ncbi:MULTISPECIES: D-2-hydroxyacid dehydrogenase [unclassified Streptomyces]|uniref:D-2-hydroxyacid dehydrogenase n=1 Tax=unclassified Streptomyces TaxID=2593676 RepID=UPI002E79F022|nr:D-2-hydroxyacid dehydrogenase [Streptomyces sp. JV190]MEE1843275.1 D-2-hydroxyacid dehydrogenase [Streptomyces sp. JV190]
MSVPTLLVLDTDPSPRLGRLTGRARIRYTDAAGLAARLPTADVLLVWDFASDAVRAAWPGDGPRPAWVHTASAGVDRLLCPELTASGTVVTNARGIFERPIAEYVTGLVLAFAKDLPGTLELQGRRQWRHRETTRLAGSRAVVVGAGPIGREITRLLIALGVQVALVGRTARRTIHGAEDLDRLTALADWVICAAPLTESTRAMFDARFFGLMQPSARFINVGRGPMVVEDDLAEALRRRWIAGAALDVFEREPLGPESPLWDVPDLIVSPHMSGDTAGWRDRLSEQFVAMYELWAAGEPLPNVVDKQRGYVPVREPGE